MLWRLFCGGNIYYWASVCHAFQWERPSAAPSVDTQKPLFINCCDASTRMQSVKKERSLPPEERKAFWQSQWWGRKKKRFLSAFSSTFRWVLQRYWQIVLRQFEDCFRDKFVSKDQLEQAVWVPYNAERSSLSSLSVCTQRRRTPRNCFHGLTDCLVSGLPFGLFFFFLSISGDFFCVGVRLLLPKNCGLLSYWESRIIFLFCWKGACLFGSWMRILIFFFNS